MLAFCVYRATLFTTLSSSSLTRAVFVLYTFPAESRPEEISRHWLRPLQVFRMHPGEALSISLALWQPYAHTVLFSPLGAGVRDGKVVPPTYVIVFISFFSASGRARLSTLRKSDVFARIRV